MTAARLRHGWPPTVVKFPPMYTRPFLAAKARTTGRVPSLLMTAGLNAETGASVATSMAATLSTLTNAPPAPGGASRTWVNLPPM